MKKYLIKRHTKGGATEEIVESDLTQAQLMQQMREAGEAGFVIKPYREEVIPTPQITNTQEEKTVKTTTAAFKGTYLSNFWPAPVEYQGLIYPTVENFYQAMRLEDRSAREEFVGLHPAEAKKKGRAAEQRKDWSTSMAEKVMLYGLRQKFFAGSELANKLLATGSEELVETNYWHDLRWGKCTCPKHQGQGENKLGILLMQVRDELSNQREEVVETPQITTIQEEKTVKKAAPQEALIKRELLAPETQEWILSILESDIAPFLQPDISSYAPGRMRTWMPYKAPLDTTANMNAPFEPGVLHGELWQWIVDLCHKYGMKAQTCLISKGGNINPHRDTTYADAWAMGINLGVCNWHIASDRDSAQTDYSMALNGGEVFSFNTKHVHAVTNAAPDRWAINVWAIANTKAAKKAQVHERLEAMLNSNQHVSEFIHLHQPGAGKTNKEEEVVKTPQITNIQASIQEAIEPRKEKEMKAPNIFHWLEESDVTNAAGNLVENYYAKDSEMVMVITNNPNPSRRQAYQDALMGGGSVKYNEKLGLWLMPVRTGTWGFHYLERLNDKGIKFTVTIRRLDLMVERYDERDDTDDRSVGEVMVEQANLAWVDNKNLYLVDIDGVPAGGEFDWSLIGITANDAKKLTKRMAEIVRLAKSGSLDELRVMVLNPEMKTKNPDFWVKVFDGKNAIRFSALPEDMRKSLKKSGHLHIMGRGFTHVDGKKFLVKGDFVVVPDYMWTWENVDVVAHGENLKTEVTTDEDLWTFWGHAPLHATTWDQQTMLNYPRILTVKSMRDDYLAEMNGIDAQLEKGLLPGQVESDLQIQAEEEIHDEFKKLVPKAEEIRKNRDLATKIKEAGFDVRMFQNLVYMSLNGFANSKAKFMHIPEFDKEGNPNYLNGKHDKHVVTMRNSFRATCVTDTFLKYFVNIPYSTERIAFFDKNVGMVWNGEHFARTFELHGTHDNDDTHFFVPVKLWSDDPKTVAKLKKSGVMLDNLAIPDKAKNAKMVLLVLRLPNGAGEYSIMEFDFSTWPKEIPFDESLVKTYNLSFRAGWVKPQPMCIPNNMPGLPTSRVYSKTSYTKADLLTDLKAQYVNPGFGAMCNALVSYSSITNGGIPSCMTDSLGNIVDATQQGADIKSFKAIDNLMDDIKTELAQIGGTMDRYFYYRRGAVAKAGVKAGTVYVRPGEIEEFDSEYKSIYTKLKYDIQKKYSFKMRQSVRINQEITRMTFNAELIAWCKKFILNMEESLSANDKMDTGMVPSKFTKPVHQAILRERRHSVVDAAIAQLEALPNTDEVMLCMWYTILTPKLMGPHATHGSSDRAICQMGSERALAHLLIDAIVNMQEKRKANVGANKVVFTSNKLVDGAFVNHVVKPLQADRATQMPIDIISDIIGKIPQNFKFVWIMADNKPLALFRRQNSSFVEVHADLPETINL